jgi:hypothetical protein
MVFSLINNSIHQKNNCLMTKKTLLQLLPAAAFALGLLAYPPAYAAAETETLSSVKDLGSNGNKPGQVFWFPDSTAAASDVLVRYKVEIIDKYAPGKPGSVRLLSAGGTLFTTANIGSFKSFTIPEFVWAKASEVAGEYSYPSFRITEVADTVLAFLFVKDADGKVKFGADGKAELPTGFTWNNKEGSILSITVSPAVPAFSKSFQDYGLITSSKKTDGKIDKSLEILILPTYVTWAGAGNLANTIAQGNTEQSVTSPFFSQQQNTTNSASFLKAAGADQVAQDLRFDLSNDKRDLEVSKTDLTRLAQFVAKYTPVITDKKTGAVISKLSAAKLAIGHGLTTDKLLNPFTLGDDAFTADSLSERFLDIIIENVHGTLEGKGFQALHDTFASIAFKVDLKSKLSDFPNLKFDFATSDGLFQGLAIQELILPAELPAIGPRWFKDATIWGIGDDKSYTESSNTVAGPWSASNTLGSSVKTIGEEAFRNAKLSPGSGSDAFTKNLSSVTSIGKSAFQAFRLYGVPFQHQGDPTGTNANGNKLSPSGFGGTPGIFNLGIFKDAHSIADSAFADISASHIFYNEEGGLDKAKSKSDIDGTNTTDEHFKFYPLTGFEKLTALYKLGKGVFANDRVPVNPFKLEDAGVAPAFTKNFAIKLPFDSLAILPEKVFDGVAFVDSSKNVPSGTSAIAAQTYTALTTSYADTIKWQAFTLKARIDADAISAKAFPQDTIYALYTVFQGWKDALSGAKLVTDFGFNGNIAGSDDALVKLINGAGEQLNFINNNYATLEIGYNFAGSRDRKRTLSLYKAYEKKFAYYKISGPDSSSTSIVTKGLQPITQELAENGLALSPLTPVGLYLIEIFATDKKPATNGSYSLRIVPTDITGYAGYNGWTADTVKLAYVGPENIVQALNDLFPVGSFLTYEPEAGIETDIPAHEVEIVVNEAAAKALAVGSEGVEGILALRGKGNYVGELQVPVTYTTRDITKGVAAKLPVIDFKIGQKDFKIPGDITLAITEGDFFYSFAVPQAETGNAVSITYHGPTGKPGIIPVTLDGYGALVGELKASYEIKANWKDYAAFPLDEASYHVSDVPAPFNGAARAQSELNALIKPYLLEEGDYQVVATLEDNSKSATFDKADSVLAHQVDVYAAATYDLYILPAGDLTSLYNDAAYIGYIQIDPISFDDLKQAIVIQKQTTGEGDAAKDTFVLSIPGFFGFESAFDGDSFTVTLPAKAVPSISGLNAASFSFPLPEAAPTSLAAFNLNPIDGKLYLIIGQQDDLNNYVKANGNNVHYDFKSFLIWTNDDGSETPLSLNGSLITAASKWNGSLTATFTDAAGKVGPTVKIPVKAVLSIDDIPTSIESISNDTKSVASISYTSNGLSIKGLAGSIAAIYSLNGASVASFPVTSDDAVFPLSLSKGFYLIKVGPAVTKFIVK